jgi:transaldolase
MKFFLDTASVAAIKQWDKTGLLDGVTTNPSLLSKEGGDPKQHLLTICSILGERDVSIEVTQDDPQDVYKQAKLIAALAPNVVVKIPCDKKYYAVIKRLVDEGVKINVTLIFTALQGLLMSKLGVRYISPFVGRLDDIDSEGVEVLSDTREILDQYGFSTQILAASLRHVRHVHFAARLGADVATLPAAVFEQITHHPLTDSGIQKFNADWQKLGIKQFP